MSQAAPHTDIRSDSWVLRRLPQGWRPYAKLMRLDRPTGIYVLLFPGWWSIALAAQGWPDPWLLLLFGIGAVVMRGAGCTVNDILDRDLDAQVERTRGRPLPSGAVSLNQALLFLAAQLLIGLVILLQLNWPAILLGAASLLLVGSYPLMKRLIWWPQVFLGLTINWGALLGWVALRGELGLPAVWLYLGAIAWTTGYDTIYGFQDIEDDARIGVKSTSRLMGANGNWLIRPAYLVAVCLWAAAGWVAGLGWPALVPFGLAVLQLGRQTLRWRPDDPVACLATFKSNVWVGWLIAAAMVAGGGWPG